MGNFYDDFADALEKSHGRKLRVERDASSGMPTHALYIYQKRLARQDRRVCVCATTYGAHDNPKWYTFFPVDEDTLTMIREVAKQLGLSVYLIGDRIQIPVAETDKLTAT